MAFPNYLRRRSPAATDSPTLPDGIEHPVGRFAALDVPAFRNYFIATVVSNIGSWMQIIAQGWLVLQLTDSAFYLGLVGLVRAVPTILLSLIGGVLADRFSRRRILIVTQSIAMCSSILLAALIILDVVTVWHILTINFITSVFFAVDNPTRQALVPDLVGKERLTSAIGLNSAAWNGAAVIGPSIAGVLIAAVGVAGAFLLNAASFVAVLGAVVAIPEPPRYAKSNRSVLGQLADGMRYISNHRAIWGILLLIAIPSLGARPYVQMMPVFARDILSLGATGYGILMAASGIGALIGALAVTSLGSSTRRGIILLGVTAILGVTLIAFSYSEWVLPSMLLIVVVGGTATLMMSLANAVLQGLVPGEMRGRVMSVYSLIAAGFMPLGSMLLGSLGSLVTVPHATAIGGAVTIATAAISARLLTDLRSVR